MNKNFIFAVAFILTGLGVFVRLFWLESNYIAVILAAFYFLCILSLAVLVDQSMRETRLTASQPKNEAKNYYVSTPGNTVGNTVVDNF